MSLNRKQKIRLIQLLLLFLVISLFSYTYQDQLFQSPTKKTTTAPTEPKDQTDEQKNKFEFVEYKGRDANGNEYIINSDQAEFNTASPEIIYMQQVTATFYLTNGILKVTSDKGVYNNVTFDIFFKENIRATMDEKILTADNLDFFNSKNIMNVYGNVKANGIEGSVTADKADLDLTTKLLNLSMLGDKQVNVKLN
jgi:LPS export ABC transporter protein LptC